jgi:tRNA modification GTPase
MFAPDDTIVAIATAAGRGGIGVVRLSGPQAPQVAADLLEGSVVLEPRRATFARLGDRSRSTVLDEVVVTWFAEPHSYTGQHVVEISAHGSPVVLQAIVRGALDRGARLARPGEFTLRAFLSGKRDLVQAEAVADLVAASTPLQARVAFDQLEGTLSGRIASIDALVFDLIVRLEASLDFPDEGYHFVEAGEVVATIDVALARIDELLGDATRGRLIREGVTVVIAGRSNVGKSSLFNRLAGAERAIVADVAGTTRDLVTERINLCGLEVTLVDTAGARETDDVVEREGVERAIRARTVADLVLVVLDLSQPLASDDERLLKATSNHGRLVVANKADCAAASWPDALAPELNLHRVSSLTGDGIDRLRSAIACALGAGESVRDTAAVSNVRHIDLLRRARASLAEARHGASRATTPEEFLLTDLQDARTCFDEVVGARTSADVLDAVFARFCIGK